MKPYIVGICGGSASGKTYLLARLEEAFKPNELTLISQDNYYKPIEQQEKDPEGEINFDHPQAVRLELLYEHLTQIILGDEVHIKQYNFNNDSIPDKFITYAPAPIIVVEGLFILFYEPIRRLLDLSIYIHADEHTKLSRRLQRDLAERGYPLNDILLQYNKYVMPMYKRYVEPYKYECDIVLPNNKPAEGLNVIVNHLKWVAKDIVHHKQNNFNGDNGAYHLVKENPKK